jgi:hypothetical protein
MLIVLTDREVGAGVDPDTGLPVVVIEGLGALGLDVPDQRFLVEPESARRVACALLFAADPGLAERALAFAAAGAPQPVVR